jgi:hypothetical protein
MIVRVLAGLLVGLALCVCASSTSAALVFQDDFDSENGGNPSPNYTGFANWVVNNVDATNNPDTVDLIETDGILDNDLGPGLFVDLAGTANDDGELETTVVFGPGTYLVEFDLAGKNRNPQNSPPDQVLFTFGSHSEILLRSSNDPFIHVSRIIVLVAPSTITFQDIGGGTPNRGAILDNVTVISDIPEPASFAIFGVGAVGLLIAKRRRKQKAA